MNSFDEDDYSRTKKRKRVCNIVASLPIIIVFFQFVFPDKYRGEVFIALFVTAAISCAILFHWGKDGLILGALPAFVCVLSGLNACYDFIHYGSHSVQAPNDKFCYFMAGICFFYMYLKYSDQEKELRNHKSLMNRYEQQCNVIEQQNKDYSELKERYNKLANNNTLLIRHTHERYHKLLREYEDLKSKHESSNHEQ